MINDISIELDLRTQATLLLLRFAPHLRILLYHDHSSDMIDIFRKMCLTAGFSERSIVRFNFPYIFEAIKQEFFSGKRLHSLRKEMKAFPWPVGSNWNRFCITGS